MPKPMAYAAISLVGAILFVWFACAFAQFATHAPERTRRALARAKPSCARKGGAPRQAASTISFALAAIAIPAMLAALFTHSSVAVAAAESGVLIGCWLAARSDFIRWKRAIGVWGCALGLTAMCASVASMLLSPLPSVTLRIGLYISAILGALAVGATATVIRFARATRTMSRHRLLPGWGERALYLAALALIVALGAGVALLPASRESDLSALGAACMLAAALGVCLLGGARNTWRTTGTPITRPSIGMPKRSDPSSWAAVPDAWLVAACGPAAFEPTNFDDWISVYQQPPTQIWPKIHHASRDLPRRRRRSSRRFIAKH